MKRDMDLMRDILILVSGSNGKVDASVFVREDRSFKLVAYHIKIMTQAGLIESHIVKEMNGSIVRASIKELTWEGNDFLSAVKSDNVWSKVKSSIAQNLEEAPIEVIKAVAIAIAKNFVIQSMGM